MNLARTLLKRRLIAFGNEIGLYEPVMTPLSSLLTHLYEEALSMMGEALTRVAEPFIVFVY